MINENKLASMDAVGELPDFGNLLLMESGYPHLPASQSDAWNEAGTKPSIFGVYQTNHPEFNGEKIFQFWNGKFFSYTAISENEAKNISIRCCCSYFQNVQWREVQP